MICKYCLIFCEVSFHFPDSVVEAEKVLIVIKFNLSYFVFCLQVPLAHISESFAKSKTMKIYPYAFP